MHKVTVKPPLNQKHYVLFYPSQQLGGAELLFSRLADKLARRGHSVTILDSEKKIIANNSRETTVCCRVVKLDIPIVVECDYFIAFASHLTSLYRYVKLNDDCKMLFWSVHPLNAIFLIPRYGEKVYTFGLNFLRVVNLIFFNSENRVRKRIISELVDADGFVCMDGENILLLTQYYKIEKEFKLIPVPIVLPVAAAPRKKLSDDGYINLAWYGRLCDFKVYPLIYLISQLALIKEKFNLNLIVIGDGPLRDLVECAVKKAGINASFRGDVPNSVAIKTLYDEVDIVFAMGTSALEAGAMGIPTVLVDASYRPIKFNYLYSWLHQTKQFTLGRLIKKSSVKSGKSVEEIIWEALLNYSFQADANLKYVKNNHNIENIVQIIEESCERSAMTSSIFLGLTKYQRPLLIHIANYFHRLILRLK